MVHSMVHCYCFIKVDLTYSYISLNAYLWFKIGVYVSTWYSELTRNNVGIQPQCCVRQY